MPDSPGADHARVRLPYVDLNLRWNPFGEPPVEDRGRLWVGRGDDWVGRSKALLLASDANTSDGGPARQKRVAIQVLGPPGSGKTTLLHAIRDELPQAPSFSWSRASGWPEPPAGDPLFVDDAHLLPRRLFRVLTERHGLVLATQESLAGRLEKRGFAVSTIPVVELLGRESVRRLVDRRLEWARRGPGPLPRIDDDHLDVLLGRHGTNIRALIWDLYRLIQTREACGE